MSSSIFRIMTSPLTISRTLGTIPMTSKITLNNSVMTEQKRQVHEYGGDEICHSLVRGIDYLRDPRLMKGMAFTLKERQLLGIHGLLPPCFKTQEEQVESVINNFNRYAEPLNRYIYLMTLQDRNERLFYRVLSENVEDMMPIVYTPTVGLACQKYGLIFRRPRGLFLTIHDAGHIYEILGNWPEPNVKAVVITDGERILGLGDLGAYGMGIPVGKLALYTALAGIKPSHCLPVVLDVGTNNEELLKDSFYIGLRQKRVTGQQYDDIIDEFMQAVVKRYGSDTVIQFEDFGNHNAFRFLSKYKYKYCTFNDDIQGTASVAVAGILASLRLTGKKLIENKYFFLGAGEASLGIATLLATAMMDEGATSEEAHAQVWLSDSGGLIVKSRQDNVNGEKALFVKDFPHLKDLHEMIAKIKPNVLIGAAAAAGAFNEKVLGTMAANNPRPVIFALSNPTSKAECTAEQAFKYTKGKCVFASGSPFEPVTYEGKTFYPGQGNNAYVFPGVALGVIAAGMHHISNKVFLRAARALATLVTQQHLDEGRLYPPLSTIRECSVKIATEIVEQAYREKVASRYPEPEDKEAFIRSQMFDHNYQSSVPTPFEWPNKQN